MKKSSTIKVAGELLFAIFCGIAIPSLLLPTRCFAKPYHTITVDGNLSDWSDDEILINDASDSDWTGGNEIEKLYLTWDKNNLYLAVAGQSTDTGLLIYFDFKDGGYSDLTKVNSWNRKVIFANREIDYFYGSWSGSDGNFYEITASSSVSDTSISKKHSSGWELAIPFDTIYKLGSGKVPISQIVSVFVSLAMGDTGSDSYGSFGYLGGDCAPNNYITGLSTSTIFVSTSTVIDTDSDGVPDDNYSSTKLKITSCDASPNPFSPDNSGYADDTAISFFITKQAQLKISVYDISGRDVKNIADEFISDTSQAITKKWDGKNKNGDIVPAGIYFINISAESSDERARKNIAVAVIK
ncbi:MAG: T9SS type A sorting domain-containing protein [Elusimicrobia bacterium]|nr:T9SS type A sorting domain-containing protein [Elusimicrobiota bacterium]